MQILVNGCYGTDLLNLRLSPFWQCTASLQFNVLLIVYVYILNSCLDVWIHIKKSMGWLQLDKFFVVILENYNIYNK